MTTLNARASLAWHEAVDGTTENPFDGIPRDAFEEGWETGYKTAQAEFAEASAQEYADDPEPSPRFSPSIWEEWAERHRTRNRRVEAALNLNGDPS